MTWDIETDVVVVGGGGCGLMAAGTAATVEGGVDVVLLEKDSDDPCTSVITSSFIPAAGTRLQRAAGIEDSPEVFAGDILRKNSHNSDQDVTLELCRRSAETIHWFIDVLGVDIEFAPEVTWFGHTNKRMHSHPTRIGVPIIDQMRTYFTSLDNTMYLDKTPGSGLVVGEACGVTGVTADQGGTELRIGAKKVVLTTGGFNANRDMLAQYIPEMADAPTIGAKTNTGEGILWGMDAGAAVDQMTGYQGRDCIFEDGTRLTPGVINEGGIAVNKTGKRFVNEEQDYSQLAAVYRAQPDSFAVFIWDERIQHMTENMHVMKESMRKGGIEIRDTVVEIAEHFDLPADVLQETVESYNDGVQAGQDAWERKKLTEPLAPPFYASRITGAMGHTQGGLKVDTSCQVLQPDGSPIPNLYAGGNTMVGLSGDTAGGYMSGNGLLVAYTSGMIIGQNVVAAIKSGS
jgi:fumarate reductase flavoprotein subunit